MEKEKEPTIQDVLDAMHAFAGNTQERFEKIDERFENIDERFDKIDERFDNLEKNLRLEIGKARDEAFVHADRKSEEVIVEVGKIINRRAEHENKFKHELVSVMKRNSLLGAKELKHLERAI